MSEYVHDCENCGCLARLERLEVRTEKVEDKEEKRQDEMNLIGKAIIEIQVSSRLTAETLAKLESKFEAFNTRNENKMYDILKLCIVGLLGILGGVLGVKAI